MNHVVIKGRITKDIEIKTSQSGVEIAPFSVAVNRDYVKEGEERQADFFNCTAFRKTAIFISNYFRKGQEILLQGRLQNRSWETENGEKRYATDIVVEKVEFCGSKQNNEGNTTIANPTPAQAETILNSATPFNNSMSDDLPF